MRPPVRMGNKCECGQVTSVRKDLIVDEMSQRKGNWKVRTPSRWQVRKINTDGRRGWILSGAEESWWLITFSAGGLARREGKRWLYYVVKIVFSLVSRTKINFNKEHWNCLIRTNSLLHQTHFWKKVFFSPRSLNVRIVIKS